jgi:hypothetical protein
MQLAPETWSKDRPEFCKPIEAVCKICGLVIIVTAATHSWPLCVHCHEPMHRQQAEDRPV